MARFCTNEYEVVHGQSVSVIRLLVVAFDQFLISNMADDLRIEKLSIESHNRFCKNWTVICEKVNVVI